MSQSRSNLKTSTHPLSVIDESSKTLQSTSDLYTAFGTLLNTSKALVTALERSDWLDRLLIFASLALFLMVAAYIVKKRLIDKGVWLAFWWVKYVPFPSSKASRADKALDLVEKGINSSSGQVAQSVVTAAASVATAASVAAASMPTSISGDAQPTARSGPASTESHQEHIRDEL